LVQLGLELSEVLVRCCYPPLSGGSLALVVRSQVFGRDFVDPALLEGLDGLYIRGLAKLVLRMLLLVGA
jgi:hypothetical protein